MNQEDVILGLEAKLQNLDQISKEHEKIKKKPHRVGGGGKEHMEIWDIKKANLPIIGIEEGEESQVGGIGQIFKRIIEERSPKVKRKTYPYKYKKHSAR